ncbi:hypothetical protein F442_12014 [Phytophthora nicotianae P10297]|uniref:Helicase-associated domain-containing protein n=1 Tax=Phytophthora nicotianae P10297 TaxID=1317064 RepID=W2Z008_PHYNI|nr:hypothetical protein F442_12014 [Phytophthora nicotianae P10297]
MLRLPVRHARRLAGPLQVYGEGNSYAPLISRCYTSLVSRGCGDSSDCSSSVAHLNDLKNREQTAGRRQKTSASEEKMLTALAIYREKNGNLVVPRPFTVPSGDLSWPQSFWGLRLGQAVNRIRTRSKFQTGGKALSVQMIEELERIGFVQDVAQYKWDHIYMPSLRQFQKLHGTTDVPHNFVVPEGNDAWPKATWGVLLGSIVRAMRHGTNYATQMAASKEELEKMGFCFTTLAERDWTEKILPSLKTYEQEFGHCLIRQDFKVPCCQPWPKMAWGMTLGEVVNRMRVDAAYVEQATRDKEILDTIGFAWNRDEAVWNQHILPGIRGYAEVFKNGKIPQKFVVPHEDPWPRSAWGTKLGSILRDMRSKGTYLGHFGRNADLLDSFGINLKLSARAWQKRIVPLLDIYATQFGGDEGIPDDFIIPSEAPWPEEVWGVHLGLIVARNVARVVGPTQRTITNYF